MAAAGRCFHSNASLACTLKDGVLNAGQKARYDALWQELQSAAQSIEELPEGYAIGFQMHPALIVDLAEFITLERLCCRFFNFTLELETGSETVWLRLTGGEGVKALLQYELGLRAA